MSNEKTTGLQPIVTEKLSKLTFVTDRDNVNSFAFLRFPSSRNDKKLNYKVPWEP